MPYNFKTPSLKLLFLFLIFLSACVKSDKNNGKTVLAYVNKEPIYLSEFKREIALRAKSDPSFKGTPEAKEEQLQSLIERRLIVQAAMQEGLAREERFVNTIKAFWEQALIRDFIEYKNSQAKDYLFATNEEINKYYDNLSKKVTFKVLRATDKLTFEEACKKYLIDKDTSAWQTLGPISFEDITDMALVDAFDLPLGEVRRFEEPDNYYLILVASREPIGVEPLEKLKADIGRRVIALKERRFFEDWLKEERRRASIKINKNYLR